MDPKVTVLARRFYAVQEVDVEIVIDDPAMITIAALPTVWEPMSPPIVVRRTVRFRQKGLAPALAACRQRNGYRDEPPRETPPTNGRHDTAVPR